MTLIVTVNGPESIWMLADRRLSYVNRPPKDDARKIMFLETIDGMAMLGYAGLGATELGREPSEWMSAVLRGRNLPLEKSLGVLADAMQQQLPRHMFRMPVSGGPAHYLMVPAFLGNEPRLYTIDLAFSSDRKNYLFRFARHEINASTHAKPRTPRLGITGSGATYLVRDKKWRRDLLSMVKANDHNRVSPHAVADHMANLNNKVHLNFEDHLDVSKRSVGPNCIVAWRYRKGGIQNGGGGHSFYTSTKRDENSFPLPDIAIGRDMEAIFKLMMSQTTKLLNPMPVGKSPFSLDIDKLNTELARIPDKPDEELR